MPCYGSCNAAGGNVSLQLTLVVAAAESELEAVSFNTPSAAAVPDRRGPVGWARSEPLVVQTHISTCAGVLRLGRCGVTNLKLMRTGVCPRSRGGFRTTWPRIVLTAIVNSGWPNGGITAGKQYYHCSSTLLLSPFLASLTKCLAAMSVPSSSQGKVLGLFFICQAP